MANMVDVVAIRRKYEKQPENVVLEVLDRLLVHLMGIVDSEPMHSRVENAPIRRPVYNIPRDKQLDVRNFSIVNKSFNNAYRTRIYHLKPSGLSFERKSPFEWLPTEVLDKILYHLVPKGNILAIDDRRYMSLESFASVEPGALSESDPLPNFRLINKRCCASAVIRQFSRLTVQFSLEGFTRLQNIAEQPHLAVHVKKLSYMVPRFYLQGRARFEELLERNQREIRDLEKQLQQHHPRQPVSQTRTRLQQSRINEPRIRRQMERANKQEKIITDQVDASGLVSALTAFQNLEQIRLMPLENDTDKRWLKFLKKFYPEDESNFSWTAACERAVNTLVHAVSVSNSNVQRFSCRIMILQAPLSLRQDSAVDVSAGIAKLKCLELNVVDRMDVPEVRAQLSWLCREVLRQAVNLEGLHIGFRDCVSFQLEAVFNNVTLERLKYVGIHMWSLHEDEIIKFLHRHRESIKALRLRNILLKEGSRWDRILRVIRREMKLKWISLRGIGYVGAQRFGAVFDDSDSDSDMHLHDDDLDDEESQTPAADAGNTTSVNSDTASEVIHANEGSDEEAEAISDTVSEDIEASENEEEEPNATSTMTPISNTAPGETGFDDGSIGSESGGENDADDESIGSESDGENDADGSELGQALHDNFISDSTMVYHSTTPESPTNTQHPHLIPHFKCDCFDGDGNAWDDLDDDGIGVTKLQWKRWEKWAVKRCELHDPRVNGGGT